jgi:hypothetical protein
MLRKLIWAVLLVLPSSGGLFAQDARVEDLRGKFQRLDEERGTVTIRIDGRDNTIRLHRDIRFYDDIGRELRGGLEEARRYFKEGQEVILSVEHREQRRIGYRLRAAPEKK